jgi:hypothetical protein
MRTAVRVVLAGAAAASAFLLFSMLWYAAAGDGFWAPLNIVAHCVDRAVPLDGRASAAGLAVGVVSTVVVAILALVPFVAMALGEGMHPLIFIGAAAVYANVLWIVGHHLLWRAIDPVGSERFDHAVAWIGHMIAGAVAGIVLYPVMRRAYAPVGSGQAGHA